MGLCSILYGALPCRTVLFPGISWGDSPPPPPNPKSHQKKIKNTTLQRSVVSSCLIPPRKSRIPPPQKNTPRKTAPLPPSNLRNFIDYPLSKSVGKIIQLSPPRICWTSSTTPFRNRPEKCSNYPPRIYGTSSTTPLQIGWKNAPTTPSNSRNFIDYPPPLPNRPEKYYPPPRIYGRYVFSPSQSLESRINTASRPVEIQTFSLYWWGEFWINDWFIVCVYNVECRVPMKNNNIVFEVWSFKVVILLGNWKSQYLDYAFLSTHAQIGNPYDVKRIPLFGK